MISSEQHEDAKSVFSAVYPLSFSKAFAVSTGSKERGGLGREGGRKRGGVGRKKGGRGKEGREGGREEGFGGRKGGGLEERKREGKCEILGFKGEQRRKEGTKVRRNNKPRAHPIHLLYDGLACVDELRGEKDLVLGESLVHNGLDGFEAHLEWSCES